MANLKLFPAVTQKQITETGVLLVLICLLLGLYQGKNIWFQFALGATLLTLLLPGIFYPLAVVWFALGQALGKFSSTILLTLLFVLLVIPVAWLKRMFGKDTLQLRQFKKDKDSVFIKREHTFQSSDIQYPF